MNIKLVLILITIAFVTGIGVFFARGKKQSSNKRTLTVGIAAGYAPWVSINAQGEYEGFDIDIAKELAATLNRELILKDLGSMAPLFMALEQGTIDVIMWGISITQERRARVAMINYQGELTTTYPLLFWKEIPIGVKSLEDMKGMKVSVEPASAQATVLEKYPNIIPLFTEKVDDGLLNLMYGKADAQLVEPAIAKKFRAKYPEIQCLDVPLSPADQVEGVGIVIKKDNGSLIADIQQAVDYLKKSGGIAQYAARWNIS